MGDEIGIAEYVKYILLSCFDFFLVRIWVCSDCNCGVHFRFSTDLRVKRLLIIEKGLKNAGRHVLFLGIFNLIQLN